MAETIQTPGWLQIDDSNFKELLEYLRRNAHNATPDPFYPAAAQLLRLRVSALIPALAADLAADGEELRFRISLLGAWLLCFPEKCEEQNVVMFCFMNCLSQAVPEACAQGLFALSLDIIMAGEFSRVVFSWDDLVEARMEIIAHKILSGVACIPKQGRELWFDGKGLLHIGNDEISVIPVNRNGFRTEQPRLEDCMRTAQDKICVYVDRSDKLKQSESGDIVSIGNFATEFRRSQRAVKPSAVSARKYQADQEVLVRVTDNAGTFRIETADPNYEKISGQLYHPKGLFYYQDSDFSRALEVGDLFKAVIVDREKGRFSIYGQVQDMLLDCVEVNKAYPAEYIQDHKEGSLWRTTSGVPVYVRDPGNYSIGDRAFLLVELAGSNGYVRAVIDEDQSGIESEDFDDSRVWFIRECIRLDVEVPKVSESVTVSSDFVKILGRALYNYQKTLSHPAEIYKDLCMCQILSELTGDERELHYLELKADYLEQLVLFARGQYSDMKPLTPSSDIAGEDSIGKSVRIVEILNEINCVEDSELLSDTIHSSEDQLLVSIARILQSYNRIKDIVPDAALASLKQSVMRSLSLEIEFVSALEDDDEYLGQEDKVKEFKTSFVYPAAKSQHMSPNIAVQSRTVFRAVCAFLNSSVGGTLYLGVSDLGYVVGLDSDLDYLKCNMDAYIRRIQNEASAAFDRSVLDFLDFELMFDDRVVAIKVRPFDDGVVCMEGVPYKRNYGQSVPMHEDEKARVIATKVVAGLKAGNKIESIERAIKDKKRAVLKRFSSSSGIEDRKVEPFSLTKDRKYVWCYDLKEKEVRQFRISGMAAVEVLNDSWAYQSEHRAQQTDIFHWSGPKATHIEWEMDITAKNILCDEYPEAYQCVRQLDREGQKWLFSTDVFQMIAPGRFYIGLAEHITVTRGEELKKYIADYIARNFTN